MVSLKKVAGEFDVPKIRESFMRQFLSDSDFGAGVHEAPEAAPDTRKTSAQFKKSLVSKPSHLATPLTSILESAREPPQPSGM